MTSQRPVTVDIGGLIRNLSESLYVKYDTCVREYVANAHDACLLSTEREPEIGLDVRSGVLSIQDNGIGMTEQVIDERFVRIARSKQDRLNRPEGAIGVFGIGVLSAFKVAEKIVVYTKHASENTGWRVDWTRDHDSYDLTEWNHASRSGTRVELHLDRDHLNKFSSRKSLEVAVRRDFAMLTVPVRIANAQKAANRFHQELAAAAAVPGGRIIEEGWARELVEAISSTPYPLEDVYGWFGEVPDHSGLRIKGLRILIGLPATERPAARHRQEVFLFSRGVLVPQNPDEFLTKELDFLVVVVDYPGLQVRLSKNEFVEDEEYRLVREFVRECAIDALRQLRRRSPEKLLRILYTHQVQLLKLARDEEAVMDVVRDVYRFGTNSGARMTWREAVEKLVWVKNGERRLPVAVVDSAAVGGDQESLLVTLPENEVVEHLAAREGIQTSGASDNLGPNDLPEPFLRLRERIFQDLRVRGVSEIRFYRHRVAMASPCRFRARFTRAGVADDHNVGIGVEALELNSSHPMIERIAERWQQLDADRAKSVADVLFSIASLLSPFDNARIEGTEILIGRMNEWICRDLDLALSGGDIMASAHCFVAMSFAPEMDLVWGSVSAVLRQNPYAWEVLRADESYFERNVLDNVMKQIRESRRFIADISGLNPNVMMELGMMMSRSLEHTLVLCDRETYEVLPANFKGMLVAVYDARLRSKPSELALWFAAELVKHPTFISMRG